jgi:hypothetical protein
MHGRNWRLCRERTAKSRIGHCTDPLIYMSIRYSLTTANYTCMYWISGLCTSYRIGQKKQRFGNWIFSDHPVKGCRGIYWAEFRTKVIEGNFSFEHNWVGPPPPLHWPKEGNRSIIWNAVFFLECGKTDKSRNRVVLTIRQMSNVDWRWIPFRFIAKDPK